MPDDTKPEIGSDLLDKPSDDPKKPRPKPIHWVTEGFVPPEALKKSKPIHKSKK